MRVQFCIWRESWICLYSIFVFRSKFAIVLVYVRINRVQVKTLTFNYFRVSTKIQNTERQLYNVVCHREFIDKCSGRDRNQPELDSLLTFIKVGDHINVHSINRLALNLKDLRSLIDEITSKGCSIKFHKENLHFTGENNPFQDLDVEH